MRKRLYKVLSILTLFLFCFLTFACNNDIPEINLKTELEEVILSIPTQTENDIIFPTQKGELIIEWNSENENVISNDGIVNRQKEDVTVRIKITIKNTEEEYSKYIEIFVPKVESVLKTIEEVIEGTIGDEYETSGVVAEINTKSFILKDETGMILVYLGTEPTCAKGDKVVVTGTTAAYGGAVQFGTDATVEKIGTEEVAESTAKELSASDADAYKTLDKISIEYVKVTGTLSISGYYYNLAIEGAEITGSISYPINTDELSVLDGKEITVTGYVTGVTGNANYLSIIATEIYYDENKLPTISQIIQSNIGEIYKTQGKVYAVNTRSFILKDETGKILVYLGKNPDVKVGDIVEVEGKTKTYGKAVQFGEETSITILSYETVTYEEPIKLTENDLDVYAIMQSIEPEYVELTGVLSISNNTYYNIIIDGTSILGSISYPIDIELLSSLNGKPITVIGYLTGITNNKYASIIATSVYAESITTENTFDLHILEVNDVHGYCLQDDYGKNGLSNLAYLVDKIRNVNDKDDVILIANGDMFQGTALSNITYGQTIIDIMNIMQFDCMTIGNHEFDWELETILKYFDGNQENGEANFPLLNANIYTNANNLVSIENGNIFESTIIEKEGYKVGIIGYIGNVYTSISYVMRKDYYFDNNIKDSVEKIGTNLKQNGCDFIIVAIHGGESSSILSYNNNKELAKLKYNGKYLVDAVINGHTHSKQEGYVTRTGGVSMPVIQAGCNGAALGEIILTINTDTREIIRTVTNIHNVYEADIYFNEDVEEVITTAKEANYDILNEVYTIAGETIHSKNILYSWVSSVMASGTGADISICNTGGIRSTGDIYSGDRITIEQMYMINPFDNYIMYVTVKGSDILSFLNNGSIFYGIFNGLSFETIESNKEYKVAVIDYVYYWDNFPQNDDVINTKIILRDLLIEDLKLRDSFCPTMNPFAVIDNQLNN